MFLSFNESYLLFEPFMFLTSCWLVLFKINSSNIKITKECSKKVKTIKLNSTTPFISIYYYFIFLNLLWIFTFRGRACTVWYNHFNINNFAIYMLYVFTLISLALFFFLKTVNSKNVLLKSVDYVFSLNNLVLLLPYLFFTNNVLIFLILIEVLSVLLFYKLVSSKIWFKGNKGKESNTKNLHNKLPQFYVNMIFFQFWVTFFSSIFIIYFYANMFLVFGTSDFFVVQILLSGIDKSLMGFNVRVLILVFVTSVFFKLGVTPFHLFKVEVYKGIPLLSILFYTTFYFSILFLFLIFVLSDFLVLFSNVYLNFLLVLLLPGVLYCLVLLFDVTLLKAFFAYSTIINVVGLVIVFISLF